MSLVKKYKILALIPARMGSSRFPGKPMAKILNKPMIGHVYEKVKENALVDQTVVATCDDEIYNYIKKIKGRAVMTSSLHERASDRCSEALTKIELKDKCKYDIIVMVQGDEPMIDPEMITQALSPMINDKEILVTNLLGKIKTKEEFEDRNCIKVVCDKKGNAMYFSREPIPTLSIKKDISMGKQICVIPFRRNFLIKYNKLEPTPLEITESIDMLRVIENGLKVKMVPTNYETQAVDTLSDLIKVEGILKST
jgi:3-deoxy-manno-octulosonate cytidylyltransferase (CMP-KDO synthetase)